jgi:hypothetical protein
VIRRSGAGAFHLDRTHDLVVGADREQAQTVTPWHGNDRGLALHRLQALRKQGKRQTFHVGPDRVGRSHRVVLTETSPRDPTLVSGFTHAAVDGDAARLRHVAQRPHQRHIKDVSVSEAGEFSKVVDQFTRGGMNG